MPPLASRAENELQALLNAAVDAVIVIDNRGTIEIFNPAAEKMFGYRAQEILGSSVTRLMNVADATHHDGYIQRYEQTGQARIIGRGREIFARRANGDMFPASLAVGAIRQSTPPRYLAFIQDISARYEATQALTRSQALLSDAETLANLGSFREHAHSKRIEWSRQMYALVGRPSHVGPVRFEEFIERLVSEADRPKLHKALKECQSTLQPLDEEFAMAHPSLGMRVIRLKAQCTPTPDLGGGFEISGTLHDITEQKQLELESRTQVDRLAHVARLSTMGEMATGLAHEINQPLTAIATYAQALLRLLEQPNGLSQAELIDTISQISTQALRASEVIKRLRNLVKNQNTETQVINLNTLTTELLTLARADATNSGIRIALNLTEPLNSVLADPIQIQQVLLNLVRNAIDATVEFKAQPALISISTQNYDGMVEVAVSDHGPGVDPWNLEQIFDPFFTTKSAGTGLGLPISRSILRAHGGTLAYRTNPGGGATFYFHLPAHRDPSP